MIDKLICDGCGKSGQPNLFILTDNDQEIGWVICSPDGWLSSKSGDEIYHSCSNKCAIAISEAKGWNLDIGGDQKPTQSMGVA
jgi:hypothetical protein